MGGAERKEEKKEKREKAGFEAETFFFRRDFVDSCGFVDAFGSRPSTGLGADSAGAIVRSVFGCRSELSLVAGS